MPNDTEVTTYSQNLDITICFTRTYMYGSLQVQYTFIAALTGCNRNQTSRKWEIKFDMAEVHLDSRHWFLYDNLV